jgi:hypothetical protein
LTVLQLKECLPVWREMFPQPIVQEWSIDAYRAGMRVVERSLLTALDKWKEKNENPQHQSAVEKPLHQGDCDLLR